jgi:L-ascorbate metabolism protein UlaG (beta-lactamase superfamily)
MTCFKRPYEKAIHAAAITVWPSIQVKEYRFHLGQSWHRKIQHLGFSIDYKKKKNYRNK